MASVAFVVSLVLFHLALFASMWLFARERKTPARAMLVVALGFLAFVAYDLVRDPARERLGGLAMGLTFMFGLLWAGGATLYSHVASRGGTLTPGLAWLARRSPYWLASGSVGTLVFGAAFPRLRGFEGADVPPGATDALALTGLALAILAAFLALLRARHFSRAMLAAPSDEARRRSAARAATAAWASLALGLSGLVLLVVSGFP